MARKLVFPQPIVDRDPRRSGAHAEQAESLRVHLLLQEWVCCGFSLKLWGTLDYAMKAMPALKLSLHPLKRGSRSLTPCGTDPRWSRELLRQGSSSGSRFSNAA